MAQIIVNTVIYLHCDILPPFISYVNEGYVKKSEDKNQDSLRFCACCPDIHTLVTITSCFAFAYRIFLITNAAMTTARINPAKITTCVIVVVTGNTLFLMHVTRFSEISVYVLSTLYSLFSYLSTIIHILRSMRYVSQAIQNFTPSQNKFYLARQVKLLATADFMRISSRRPISVNPDCGPSDDI